MISFIVGKPGGGKTLYAVKLALDEFVRKDGRPVVTNIVFRRHKLAAYVSWKTGCTQEDALAKVENQLWQLEDDDMKSFFRFRGRGLYLDPKTDKEISGRTDKVPDFSQTETGCVYLLDEIQNVFNARGWKDSGQAAIYYLSQHRKLDDDIVLVSQHPELVDKQFRLLVHEWHTVRNRHQDKLGPFKLGSHFERKSFYSCPNGHVHPFDSDKFKFVQDIADCYDTMAGVGIRGRGEPSLRAAKGPPLKLLYAAGVCLVIGSMLAVYYTPKLFASSLNAGAKEVVQAAVPVSHAAAPQSPASVPARASASPESSKASVPWPVFLVGDVVHFSDGSTDHVSRRTVTMRSRFFAVIDGCKVRVSS